MRVLRIGPPRTVDRWASHGVEIGGVARYGASDGTGVALARFVPGSVLGRHPTRSWQLFAVVAGSGWVAGDDGERRPLAEGEAALWTPGEEHESGSEAGMTVCIVESAVDPTGSGQ